MRKQISTALLLASLLGLIPAAAAEAAPAQPTATMQPGSADAGSYDAFHHNDDGHYRCWYHCDRRHRPYDRFRHRKYCWYHDRDGWYYSRCHGKSGRK
jgi:hypothetical protein